MLTNALTKLRSLSLSLLFKNRQTKTDIDRTQPKCIADEEVSTQQPESTLLDSELLVAIFKKQSCCTLDGLNEYDDDFSEFTPLGELITHEMKRIQLNELEEFKTDASSVQPDQLMTEIDSDEMNNKQSS